MVAGVHGQKYGGGGEQQPVPELPGSQYPFQSQ